MLSFQCRAMHDLQNISLNTLFLFYYLVDYFNSRVFFGIFFGFLCDFNAGADCTISNLYDSILDLEHHSHDFLDSFFGSKRSFQHYAAVHWLDRRTLGIPSFFRFFNCFGVCSSLRLIHGGANLQQHDAHRSFFN